MGHSRCANICCSKHEAQLSNENKVNLNSQQFANHTQCIYETKSATSASATLKTGSSCKGKAKNKACHKAN